MTNDQNQTKPELFDVIAKDPTVRRFVTRENHSLFFSLYLRHYIKHPMAEFQKDIIRVTEDTSNNLACIVAFRGSAKSTLVTLSYAIWSVLGVQQKKFVLIICQTQSQAKQHMTNLRSELESNLLLQSDLGPFQDDKSSNEWAISSIVFKNTGARITIASLDQSIRGIRHHQYRPDLIILDDIEDLNSTKTMEGRNKTYEWFTREIVPLGDEGTRIILVGNLLHEDSLMMRLKKLIETKELDGVFLSYPLLDEQGKCLWPGKFDTEQKINDLRRKTANEFSWQQEYLLKIISDSTRAIWPEWIQYYDTLPNEFTEVRATIVGIDLAISEEKKADCTAMVTLRLYGRGENLRVYVLPNPINARMGYLDTIETIKALERAQKAECHRYSFIIETNGFQEIYVETLKRDGSGSIKGVKSVSDKRTRLVLASGLVQRGNILFPKQGAEELIAQLTGFGVEHHDDLCDAFSIAVIELLDETKYDDSDWKVIWL